MKQRSQKNEIETAFWASLVPRPHPFPPLLGLGTRILYSPSPTPILH